MFVLDFVLIAALFIIFGSLLFLVEDLREPTIWKFYFPPLYEKTSEKNKIIIYRTLKNNVKKALGWYFLVAGIVILLLLFAADLQV